MSENDQKDTKEGSELEQSYKEIVDKAEEQHPGINELLTLYGEFQKGLIESQAYLQLFQKTFITANSDTSTR